MGPHKAAVNNNQYLHKAAYSKNLHTTLCFINNAKFVSYFCWKFPVQLYQICKQNRAVMIIF